MHLFHRHVWPAAALALCLLLGAGCASSGPGWGGRTAQALPPAVRFNASAGLGDLLYVPVRVEGGPEGLFLLDTGSPVTVLDKSLEPKLGPKVGTVKTQYAWFGEAQMNTYATPTLSIGGTPLRSGALVHIDDLRRRFPRPVTLGILGMDCLRHYCLQFDFTSHRLRFLPSGQGNSRGLGEAHPLSTTGGKAYTEAAFLSSHRANFLIDTGCTIDAVMKPQPFAHALRTQTPLWSRRFQTPGGIAVHGVGFARGKFEGDTYAKLIVDGAEHNFIGLRFLARHLVTLDFPSSTLYLRKRRDVN